MEELKSFDALFEPDERWEYFTSLDTTSPPKLSGIEERYKCVEQIKLNDNVPEDLKSQFNIAKMLCIYAWLYYPFHQASELKAFSTLEMGLRLIYPNSKKPLKKLISSAIEDGLIVDKGFSHIAINEDKPTEYSQKLPALISAMRNDIAHGSVTLHPNSILSININAEIINQLFMSSKIDLKR